MACFNSCFHSFRYFSWTITIVFLVIICSNCRYANANIQSERAIIAAQRGDLCSLKEIFAELSSENSYRASMEFVSNFISEIEQHYEIKISEKEVMAAILYAINDLAIAADDREAILNMAHVLCQNLNIDISCYRESNVQFILCSKKEKSKEPISEPDNATPAGVVIGAVEVVCGALLCILPIKPARVLGTYLVCDGITRVLNKVEDRSNEIEAENNSESGSTQIKMDANTNTTLLNYNNRRTINTISC